jgi:hypothetical protein
MALSEGASLFIPLLFLVIMEISAIARDLDLRRIADEELPPFFVGLFYFLDSGPQERVGIPQLGRFNFIHGANLAIITLGFVLVSETTTGFSGHVVALLTWIVWALLPVFEVDEYEEILAAGRPLSFYHHAALSTVGAAFLYSFESLRGVVGLPPGLPSTVAVVVGSLVVYYAALYGFLALLEGELERRSALG